MMIAAVVGYLLGSIPTAQLVGRWSRVDPRTRGDGNPGWWNMRGLVGDRRASIVLIIDVLKGAAASLVGLCLWGPWWTAYVAAGAAMVGHAFPLFAGFRGGRGVLTFAGSMSVINPAAALASAVTGVIVGFVGKRLIYGTRASIFVFPLVQSFFVPRARVITTVGLMAFTGLRFVTGVVRPNPAPVGTAGI